MKPVFATLLAAATFSGCGKPPAPVSTMVPLTTHYHIAGDVEAVSAIEFRLADGTRCVAFRQAITCQWPTLTLSMSSSAPTPMSVIE